MKIEKTTLPGVLLVKPKLFGDTRGFFIETWNRDRYAEQGLDVDFVQDNLSFSRKGILRGLHFQNPHGQGKLVQVLEGEVFDVAVDIRKGSPTFGQWLGVNLSSENRHQFYVPAGFAHGFCVLSETALFSYKCSDLYHPEHECSILWNDPDLKIDWPVSAPQLSEKDRSGRLLRELPETSLPEYIA
ncbi:MAG: dTDP-4-dehydrorhamnose 3,5-epimerase [Gammaproteobacteria bacterium]|nr:MAG: dTDP-4-dehydrorhamnose 3,5-epimerase [Gammaproteobacteria bacterium]RLA18857.1 MAG: dTDP-4-dehydrorhamnose 3,5-epimerase [Gammaproteobacteria bacterium]